jgi:superfamily II DNA/RNA helicase
MQNAVNKSFNEGNSIVLNSPTGSGKTLAYLLPILPKLDNYSKEIQLLVVVPTRELGLQIEEVIKKAGVELKTSICYGGHAVKTEKNSLQVIPQILIGTPGRLCYHIRNNNVDLSTVNYLVLDEYDKSLEFGFQEDILFILNQLKNTQQSLLISATTLKDVPNFIKTKAFSTLNYTEGVKELDNKTEYKIVKVVGDDKLEALMLLIGKLNNGKQIVFCNHREAVERIAKQLKDYKIPSSIYHGGLEQLDREKALIKFRNGSVNLLITTDLASRGLDIPEIDAVIHYQLPTTEDAMVHRNGRTARMNAEGAVYFLLDKSDYIPPYFKEETIEITLPNQFTKPTLPLFTTVYVAAGKKDKINKIDIVGMFIQKGGLEKTELGRIDVLDNCSFVAVQSNKLSKAFTLLQNEKIKGRKIKMDISG